MLESRFFRTFTPHFTDDGSGSVSELLTAFSQDAEQGSSTAFRLRNTYSSNEHG
jgi:hypothetical protein